MFEKIEFIVITNLWQLFINEFLKSGFISNIKKKCELQMQHGNKLNLGPLLDAFNGLFVDSYWRRMKLSKFKKL